ncbi:MAG TPA: site-2 protease family protein [Vicinamibacterales bacterium]|nr:site-2 protease family protein [Vicinamibacterales bacterium]
MLRGTVRLGRIFGIEIALHFSWFIIAALLTISLAGQLYAVNREWPHPVIWLAAGAAALAFFAAILLHELSHARVARARGVEVASITLFALGGMARMRRDTADARTEFWVGLAGPIASVLIGIAALGLASLLGWNRDATPDTPGMVMLVWFGFINLTLAAFNMIPGFPLDGGRVLRAIIWWRTGNQARATRIAAALGQIVASAFILIGLMSFFFGHGFGGLWLAFIGLFLIDAARATLIETTIIEGLRGVRVRDVMSHECARVETRTPVSDVADEVLRTGKRCFFVIDHGHVAGMVTPHELRAVPRDQWNSTPVRQAMKPVEQLHRIDADAPVTEALDAIAHEDVNQLPVLEYGAIRGIISRDQILRLLAVRAELTS